MKVSNKEKKRVHMQHTTEEENGQLHAKKKKKKRNITTEWVKGTE